MMSPIWRNVLIGTTIATAAHASVIDIRQGAPSTTETWKPWTCPLPSTVSLSFTQYVPVTTTIFETDTNTTAIYGTITQATTIYQTIISTETVVESTGTTATETTTSPVTLTATLEEELFTVTSKATSTKICPTRLVNPTFTVAEPLPSDWTWGCPPGWLCKPKQDNCNLEIGLPDRGFYCSPNECEPAEVLPGLLPTWDDTIYGNDSAATNPALRINTIDDFFNMNPADFGLSYEIFVVNEVRTYTSTITILPTPTVGARQAQTSIPGACYPWCNNCLLEAQSAGKSPKLCMPGSAFDTSFVQCQECINVHRDDNSGSFVQIAPQFQQFLDYCARYSTAVIATVASQTTSVGQNTYTTLVATTSVTIVPTASASEYATLLSTAIIETSVSTATLISSSEAPPPATISSTPPTTSVLLTSVAATTIPLSSTVGSSVITSSVVESSLVASSVAASSVATSSLPASSLTGSSVAVSSIASSPSGSQSLVVYTTTSTILATSTASAVTYNGTQVTSLTIIMTSNGTATTMSGSELNTYTVILPPSTVVSSAVTTMTMTSSGGSFVGASSGASAGSGQASVAATSVTQAVSASSPAAPPASTFTGGAAPGISLSSRQDFICMILGCLIMLI